MDVSIVGTGYVGLVTGLCLAEVGNQVCCADKDYVKIAKLNRGENPIYEQGLEELLKENLATGNIKFTTDVGIAIKKSDMCFIAVGTPSKEDGSADLSYVMEVAETIGLVLDHHMHIVNKSTVPVGTVDRLRGIIQKQLDWRGSDLTFSVLSNPEFLKEGTAVADCMRPDRIIIGADTFEAANVLKELYRPFSWTSDRFIVMDIKSAEMTKYTANAMLATKISFMNEISNICERVGADVNKVRLGIGSDHRIGYQFIYPGCGYGGSCFPKDVQALINISESKAYNPAILKAVEKVNEEQKYVLTEKVCKRYSENLSGRVFAVWGLSFKPNTDDMRFASSITIISSLVERGAVIKAYDPKAMPIAKDIYIGAKDKILYCEEKYEALEGADALLLVTEWKEFRSPDFHCMKQRLREPVIFDGRNQYDAKQLETLGFEYYQIGVSRGRKNEYCAY